MARVGGDVQLAGRRVSGGREPSGWEWIGSQPCQGATGLIITTAFGMDELDDAKPRLASRLMDSMVVEWIGIDAPDYRGQRRADPPVLGRR